MLFIYFNEGILTMRDVLYRRGNSLQCDAGSIYGTHGIMKQLFHSFLSGLSTRRLGFVGKDITSEEILRRLVEQPLSRVVI